MPAKSLHSCLTVTLWTVAHQAPLLEGFSRQEYWSGLPSPPPGDLPDPGHWPCTPIRMVFILMLPLILLSCSLDFALIRLLAPSLNYIHYPLFHYSTITHMLFSTVISSQSWFYLVCYPTFDLVARLPPFEALPSLCFQHLVFWFFSLTGLSPVSSAGRPYLTGPLMLEHLRGRSLNFSISTAPLVIPWNFTVLGTMSKVDTLA